MTGDVRTLGMNRSCAFITLFNSARRSPLSQQIMACRSKLSREEASVIKDKFQKVIPQITSASYKGSSGKIGVIGGSTEYSGAPFFAAMAALRIGADVASVFCHPGTAAPIKSYSPDLIVYPALKPELVDGEVVVPQSILRSLHMMTSVVIGCGLGRESDMLRYTANIMEVLKNESKPMVIDGDGLYLLSSRPNLLPDFEGAVLTPNAKEFERLWTSVMKSDPPGLESCPSDLLPDHEQLKEVSSDHHPYIQDTVLLAKHFPGCVLVRKGIYDVITDGGPKIWVCGWKGSDRRVSGQGDLLAGITGTLLSWSSASQRADTNSLSPLKAATIACVTVREASRLSFTKHGRSLITSDILVSVGLAFQMFQP